MLQAKTDQSDIETDLTSAGISMTPETTPPPDTTKGQRANIEDKLRGRAAEAAKSATKQLSLHARRRRASQSSTETICTLSTKRHQSKRHQSTVLENCTGKQLNKSVSKKAQH